MGQMLALAAATEAEMYVNVVKRIVFVECRVLDWFNVSQ